MSLSWSETTDSTEVQKGGTADRYGNFADLAAHEKENLDFRVWSDKRPGAAAIIAPHGSGIEPDGQNRSSALGALPASISARTAIARSIPAKIHRWTGYSTYQ
jgi:hypothetical protein